MAEGTKATEQKLIEQLEDPSLTEQEIERIEQKLRILKQHAG